MKNIAEASKAKVINLKPEQAQFLERLVLFAIHGEPVNDGEGLSTDDIVRATEILKKLRGRGKRD